MLTAVATLLASALRAKPRLCGLACAAVLVGWISMSTTAYAWIPISTCAAFALPWRRRGIEPRRGGLLLCAVALAIGSALVVGHGLSTTSDRGAWSALHVSAWQNLLWPEYFSGQRLCRSVLPLVAWAFSITIAARCTRYGRLAAGATLVVTTALIIHAEFTWTIDRQPDGPLLGGRVSDVGRQVLGSIVSWAGLLAISIIGDRPRWWVAAVLVSLTSGACSDAAFLSLAARAPGFAASLLYVTPVPGQALRALGASIIVVLASRTGTALASGASAARDHRAATDAASLLRSRPILVSSIVAGVSALVVLPFPAAMCVAHANPWEHWPWAINVMAVEPPAASMAVMLVALAQRPVAHLLTRVMLFMPLFLLMALLALDQALGGTAARSMPQLLLDLPVRDLSWWAAAMLRVAATPMFAVAIITLAPLHRVRAAVGWVGVSGVCAVLVAAWCGSLALPSPTASERMHDLVRSWTALPALIAGAWIAVGWQVSTSRGAALLASVAGSLMVAAVLMSTTEEAPSTRFAAAGVVHFATRGLAFACGAHVCRRMRDAAPDA